MEWIPTRWEIAADLDAFQSSRVSIERTNSPHYEGIRYAVRYADNVCVNTSGELEWEPMPSGRDESFYERCRFTAFDAAKEIAERIRLNTGKNRFRDAKGA